MGSALVYSTYLGGSGDEYITCVKEDAEGNAYVTGATGSTDFPLANPLQNTFGGGYCDAFVTKLNPSGSALVYSTYLGGTDEDAGTSIVIDATGNAYVAGETTSSQFPTVNPVQASFAGVYDAFVAKLNPVGSALIYSTYLGGDDLDEALGLAVDNAGNACVTGVTGSSNFLTATPLQGAQGGYQDAFVAKLNSASSALIYSTCLGGSDWDGAYGIALDAAANAYVVGFTSSGDFPTAHPLQLNLGGSRDPFVSKVNPAGSALQYSTYLGGGSWDEYGYGIAVDATGDAYVTGYTSSRDFPTAHPLQGGFGGGNHDAFVAKLSPSPIVSLSGTSMTFAGQAVETTSPK